MGKALACVKACSPLLRVGCTMALQAFSQAASESWQKPWSRLAIPPSPSSQPVTVPVRPAIRAAARVDVLRTAAG